MNLTYEQILAQVLINEGVKNGSLGFYTADGTTTVGGLSYKHNKESLAECGIYGPEDMHKVNMSIIHFIYKEDYWKPCRAENLRGQLQYLHFDAALNQGISGSGKILQTTINLFLDKSMKIKVDGIVGPRTLKAYRDISECYIEDVVSGCYRVIRKGAYYADLFKRAMKYPDEAEAILERFEKSWLNRLRDII